MHQCMFCQVALEVHIRYLHSCKTGVRREMYMNLLHPLWRLEHRSFSSSVSCSKELTCRSMEISHKQLKCMYRFVWSEK